MNGEEIGAMGSERRKYPVSGVLVATIGAAVAAVASWWAWPDMAATYEEVSGPNLRPSVANRTTAAIGIPILLAVMALILIPIVYGDRRLSRKLPALSVPQSPTVLRNQARVLSATWIGLTIVLLTLHLAILGQFTDRSTDIWQLVGIGFGFLMACIGSALPLARPTDPSKYPQAFRRLATALEDTYRPAGFALVAVGAATIVISVFSPPAGVTVGWVGFVVVMLATSVKVALSMK